MILLLKIDQQRIGSGEYTICDTMLVQYFRKYNPIMIPGIHLVTSVLSTDFSISISYLSYIKTIFPFIFPPIMQSLP